MKKSKMMMGVAFALWFMISFTACGKREENNIIISSAGTGYLNLQGYHLLPDGGYADIVSDTGDLQDVITLRLVVKNADGTTGLIPLASALNLPTVGDKIYYSSSLTYAAGNVVKADVGNALLNGSMLTFLTLTRDSGKLNIRVQISSNTGVVFDHTVVAQ